MSKSNLWLRCVQIKIAAKYRLCRCRCKCKCKINNLIMEKTGPSVLFILPGPPTLLTPFSFLDLLFFRPALFWLVSGSCICLIFFPTSFSLYLCFSKIADCFGIFSASKIALNVHLIAFAAKLQSYC